MFDRHPEAANPADLGPTLCCDVRHLCAAAAAAAAVGGGGGDVAAGAAEVDDGSRLPGRGVP